jgi:hypothetical protein
LGGVVAMIHEKPRPIPAAVIAKIDGLVERQVLSSSVALAMAAVLRRLAAIAAADTDSAVEARVSQEQPEFDWEDASDGCVEGELTGAGKRA